MLRKSITGLALALALQHTAAADDLAVVKEQLSKMFPSQIKFEVSESPMPGVFEVSLGRRTIYAFAKGDHLLLGDVYDTERGVNLAEEEQAKKMAEALAKSPVDEMIIMGKI
ncbi:MAG: disulfide isomerase DsbC N-terminal domain-containing protein, partial [Pseudomonadota bacterium]|nr:disulfide isomerase DsbC N-terminal domain-containing protein [Pseudomonadota bacterium]